MDKEKQNHYQKFCESIIDDHIEYKRDKYNDRNVLESIIFPFVLAKYEPQDILDIGREDYQSFYNEFFEGRNLWTIDMNPEHADFGMPGQHICDNSVNLKEHFNSAQFDFILMNGVFGWGLDAEDDVQTAFKAVYDILRPGGIFILGYNDDVVPLKNIEGLQMMNKIELEPLKNHQFKCANGNHTYNFFQK